MIVFLVGAGATLAEALPGHPNQAKTPPLDATFFSLCRKASLEGGPTLRRYLTANYGMNPFADGAGMEEVFNVVYADAFSGLPTTECLDAYWALLKMYRDAIARTTNWLTGRSRAGIGGLLRFFARGGETDLVFITFNQDLVIEKAIEAAKDTRRYNHLSWDIDTAYQVNFQTVHQMARDQLPFLAQTVPPVKPIRVLKLHGSLNWVYRARSAKDAKNALRSPRTDLILLNDQVIHDRLMDGTAGRKKPLLPFVVPPVYEKSTQIRDVLQPVWREARDALRNADELVIFGYSCPDADQAARNMIKQAFHKNSRIEHIHVVDPSPASSARLGDLLRAPVLTRYSTVGDFITHYRSG